MIDDEQAREIKYALSALQAKGILPKVVNINAKNFEKLIPCVSSMVMKPVSECVDFLSVVALCYLGPSKSVPPARVRRRFHGAVKEHAATNNPREVYYLALAWGCGHRFRIADNDESKDESSRGKGVEDDKPWEDIWPEAQVALSRLIELFVWQSIKWLAASVTDFIPPQDLRQRSSRKRILEEIVWGDAMRLARRLTDPMVTSQISGATKAKIHCADSDCDDSETRIEWGNGRTVCIPAGSKVVFEIATKRGYLAGQGVECEWRRDLEPRTRVIVLATEGKTRIRFDPKLEQVSLRKVEVAVLRRAPTFYLYQCGCGTAKCAERHRLASWNPETVTLPAFVASAVKGPNLKLQTGGFEQGAYYALLAREGIEYQGVQKRLRRVPVEYKLCSDASCRDAQGKRTLYEGNKCPRCKRGDDIHLVARTTKDELIVIASEASPYAPQLRLKCHNEIEKTADTRTQKCGNLFTQRKCPICGWIPRGLGRTQCLGIVQITKAGRKPIDCGTGGRLATHNGEQYVQWQEGSDRIKLQAGDTIKRCRCVHDEPRCPACGLSRQLRPVLVWVRTGATRVPYDPDRDAGESPDDD